MDSESLVGLTTPPPQQQRGTVPFPCLPALLALDGGSSPGACSATQAVSAHLCCSRGQAGQRFTPAGKMTRPLLHEIHRRLVQKGDLQARSPASRKATPQHVLPRDSLCFSVNTVASRNTHQRQVLAPLVDSSRASPAATQQKGKNTRAQHAEIFATHVGHCSQSTF